MHILCVDDDQEFLELSSTFLSWKLPSATILTATCVQDARSLVESEPIVCIVSDYNLPDQTGLELLYTVRETQPNLPFILFTGKGSEEIASEAISAGVTDYLQKRGAEQYDLLSERISHAVSEYQAERELEERVKELTAIQTISDLLSDSDVQISEQIQQIVTYLPQSLQFPETAVASLSIDQTEFTSPEYERPAHQLSVEDVTTAGNDLELTVGYTSESVPETDGSVFLPEERKLLTTILQLVTASLDRRHILSDLQEADRRLNLILDHTTAVMYLKDTDCRYVFVNTEYERLFDLNAEDIVGQDDEALHSSDVAETIQTNDRDVLESGEPIEVEEEFCVNGAERTYLSLKVPVRDAGEIEGVFCVSTEITDRKERERQLESLNTEIPHLLSGETVEEVAQRGVTAAREILDLQANSIHLYDAEIEGLVPVAYTDEVLELIGDPPTFRDGGSIAWRVFADGNPTAIDDVKSDPDIYNPESPIRSELLLPLGEHGILVAGSPTPSEFDSQDVAIGSLLATHLTTALSQVKTEQTLREREAELEAQNERLEQFASMVSHDLRNPLSVAFGNLELYRERGDESHLDTIETSLDRIQELVTDLTALVRHGIPDENHERVSVAEVAREAWEFIDTRSATLDIERCTITADPSQLKTLFENLFRNAVGYGGADVTVRVGPLEHGFYVEDTGDGIPSDERDAVFDHGYTTGYGGSGTGLTIVSRIAQAHDWDITLTDSKEGGARFEFRIKESIQPIAEN